MAGQYAIEASGWSWQFKRGGGKDWDSLITTVDFRRVSGCYRPKAGMKADQLVATQQSFKCAQSLAINHCFKEAQ